MPYIDGLPTATSVSGSDLVTLGQGGTPGVPGTATPRKATVSQLVGNGTVVGPSSSANGNAVVFNGVLGNILADGGGPPFLANGGTITGETVFAGSGSAVQIGTTVYVAPNGSDDTANLNTVFAALTAGTIGCVRLVGHFQCSGSLAQIVLTSAAGSIIGDGPETTTITFNGATDGISIKLSRSTVGAQWGTVTLQNFGIIRGPTTSTAANSGLAILADPSVLSGESSPAFYTGMPCIRDISVRGNYARTTQWQNGVTITGLTDLTVDNLNVQGPGQQSTDAGDWMLKLVGMPTQAIANVAISNSVLQGGSNGLWITGFAQGVYVSNCTIIGDYYGIRWNGIGDAVNHPTAAATSAGDFVLNFGAGNVPNVKVLDVVNGTNIASQSRVSAINYMTGAVTINNAVLTGGVAYGAPILIAPYYTGEELNVSTSTFEAAYRDIYLSWLSFSTIGNDTFIRYGAAVDNWAAIHLDECNDNAIGGPITIYGGGTGSENGILISSSGSQGMSANSIGGAAVIHNIRGAAVYLQGTVVNTAADLGGFNILAAGASCYADIDNVNAVTLGMFDGNAQGFNFNTNTGTPKLSTPVISTGYGSFSYLGFSTTSAVIASAAGAPSAVEPVGSLYLRSDGATGARLYVSAGGGTWNAVAGV